ncbi:MAG: methyl-accepting chemotaxis protein [Magnetococcales bacterium]|nr:methyl-accepting chemotaxis protein [Magnetococcales bacterium]MBF0113815.1 methyl-accepting chemotaxis protein [Magnetococcales bacterium]
MKMRLSVKLISLFLLFGILPLLVVSILLNQQASDALRAKSYAMLEAVRESHGNQVEKFFQSRLSDAQVIAETVAVVETLKTARRTWQEYQKTGRRVGSSEWTASMQTPLSHFLEQFKKQYGYYDLLLIDVEGRVVYSVARESDLGEDLLKGPLQGSGLARLFTKAKGGEVLEDFSAYSPSKGAQTAFVGAPIKRDGELLGVVAMQLTTAEIDAIVQSRAGMGQSGESYLVGKLGDKTAYRSDRVTVQGRIGQEKSDTFIEQAIAGSMGTALRIGAGGEPVLSSYGPLSIPGFQWAIVSVIKESEAFAAVTTLNLTILVVAVVCAVVVVCVGWLVARSISKPLLDVIQVISSSSAEMAATVTEQERVAAQQAASVNETNTTMEELGASSRQSAEQAEVAANSADKALELSQFGMSRVEDSMASMEKAKTKVEAIAQQILLLSEKTGQIRDIANLVSDFANETKMLAMNAAVEAVRAGEHGKGFAVLAMETRKLADESKRSAGRINGLVSEVQKANNSTVMATEEGSKVVDDGMVISQNTAETFREVAQAMNAASQGAQQISLNVRQQSVAIRQVVEAMKSVNAGARESQAGMGQVKEGIRTLNEAAQTLQKMV